MLYLKKVMLNHFDKLAKERSTVFTFYAKNKQNNNKKKKPLLSQHKTNLGTLVTSKLINSKFTIWSLEQNLNFRLVIHPFT